MEILVFDKDFRNVKIIDAFNSLVWNDMYIGCGDFELEFPMNENALAYIEEGYYLTIQQSSKIMIIEEIRILTSFQYGNVCRLSGRSLESILERRVVRNTVIASGSLQDTILRLLNENVINASNENRNIPGFCMKLSEDERITELEIYDEYKVGNNLYSVIYSICELYNIGFRITVHEDRFFMFELYVGVDHSYQQDSNPYVVFSPQFENLEESEMTINLSNHKNCAEIDYETTENITKPSGGDPNKNVIIEMSIGDDISGIDRREIYLSSSFKADAIDKSMFGTAEDRVDRYKYSSWVKIGFDRAGYNAAMEEWNRVYYPMIVDASTPRVTTEWRKREPGDPGYIAGSEGTHYEWLNYSLVEVRETPEEAIKRSAAYVSSVESLKPDRSDYERWGWEITDWTGYNAAISAAQKQINKEFEEAQTKALNYAKAIIIQQSATELCKYKNISSFDGEIDPNVNFIYGVDYELGDIVQIVNRYNFNAITRIVGVLISQDNQNGIIVRPEFKSDDEAKVEFDLLN